MLKPQRPTRHIASRFDRTGDRSSGYSIGPATQGRTVESLATKLMKAASVAGASQASLGSGKFIPSIRMIELRYLDVPLPDLAQCLRDRLGKPSIVVALT